MAVVLSLFASYVVAMTVVPLFCAKLIKSAHGHDAAGHEARPKSAGRRFNAWFNRRFTGLLNRYESLLQKSLLRPLATVLAIGGIFVFSLGAIPFIGVALTLWLTGTTLNVMSLMGIVMMVGVVTSNSILIVEFVRQLRADGNWQFTRLIRLMPLIII